MPGGIGVRMPEYLATFKFDKDFKEQQLKLWYKSKGLHRYDFGFKKNSKLNLLKQVLKRIDTNASIKDGTILNANLNCKIKPHKYLTLSVSAKTLIIDRH